MFERFTKDARAVVEGAVAHAEREGAERVEETHLLLSLLDREGSRGSFALASLGLPPGGRDGLVRDLAEARRRGGLSRADADALSGLGIDLSDIVSKVEEAHGEGALAAGTKGGPLPGGRDGGRSAAAPRTCWSGPCASPSPTVNAASVTSTSCSPWRRGPASPPKPSPTTA